MHISQKLIVKTDKNRVYALHIMNADEYDPGKVVGLFLYFDDNNGFSNMRHRLLFENSVDAVKDKVVEYANGRGENIMFVETPLLAA